MKNRVQSLSTLLILVVIFGLFVTIFQSGLAFAEQDSKEVKKETKSSYKLTAQDEQMFLSLEAAIKACVVGPAKVSLINQGYLNLPKGYIFVPKPEAINFMHTLGNSPQTGFIGLIMPSKKEQLLDWFITINFENTGYVKDDEADNLKTDALLKDIQKNTEEANQESMVKGFESLVVLGWAKKPNYDKKSHQINWSIIAKEGNQPINTVNFTAFALGREGSIRFNLVTMESTIKEQSIHMQTILESLHYIEGKRYEDFVQGRDRIAEYGIAALITGVVAKKLGLLALIAAFCIKMWKFIIVLPLILWYTIKKLFKKN